MIVDLHIHTTASDGTWDNKGLLNKLVETGISVFSITDHNSLENVFEMKNTIIPRGLIFVPGVELSCIYEQDEYHITAYGFDLEAEVLKNLALAIKCSIDQWQDNLAGYVLAVTGQLSRDDFEQYSYEKERGGWKLQNYLLDKGIVSGMEDFMKFVMDSGMKPDLPEASKVIEVIKKAGGRPFLAHPSVYDEGRAMQEGSLKKWLAMGIMGLECFHPTVKNKVDENYYLNFCKRNDLMITGGSDCHGDFLPARLLGKPKITIDMIKTDFIEIA